MSTYTPGPALLAFSNNGSHMTVVGCTGHQNIPTGAASYVREGLLRELQQYASSGLVGLSSLAIGADQLFAQLVLDLHGQLEVIVPSRNYESTFDAEGAASFWQLLGRAAKTETLDWPEPSEDAYLSAGRLIVDRSDLLLAIWDGERPRGRGGTGDIVKYAEHEFVPTVVIWPTGVKR